MITKTVDEKSQSLADYIISQVLVKDYDAISIKLAEENKGDIHYQWLNLQPNNIHKQMKWIFPFSWKYSVPLRSINGQDFARELYIKGFTQLYLATGYDATHFGDMPWIKAFVGKNPPF